MPHLEIKTKGLWKEVPGTSHRTGDTASSGHENSTVVLQRCWAKGIPVMEKADSQGVPCNRSDGE